MKIKNDKLTALLEEMSWTVSELYEIQGEIKNELSSSFYTDEETFFNKLSKDQDYYFMLDILKFCFEYFI